VETGGLELRAKHAVLVEPVSGPLDSSVYCARRVPSHMATRQERVDPFIKKVAAD
jgi:hypothetical protein